MIVVIGATSFIGVYLVDELLKQGKKVLATGRDTKFKSYFEEQGVSFTQVDITNEKDFEKLPEDAEGVILLAGLLPANLPYNTGTDYAANYFKVNTIGTINVLEYCRRSKINRLISTSSYADVRNAWSAEHKIDEEEPRNYQYYGDHATYVFSKNAASDMLEYYNQQYGMKNAVFRFPMVLGIGPHGYYCVDGKVKKSGFQVFLDNALMGKKITIFGDSSVSRDLVYVKDVAKAFVQAIDSPNTYGLYNISSGTGTTLFEQAKIMSEVFKTKKQSEVVEDKTKTNNSNSFIFSIEKAKKDFGYNPEFSNFKDMMIDYKKDLESSKYPKVFGLNGGK